MPKHPTVPKHPTMHDVAMAARQAMQNQELRDKMAMRAMAAYISANPPADVKDVGKILGEVIARRAYDMADFMMTERQRRMMQTQNLRKAA